MTIRVPVDVQFRPGSSTVIDFIVRDFKGYTGSTTAPAYCYEREINDDSGTNILENISDAQPVFQGGSDYANINLNPANKLTPVTVNLTSLAGKELWVSVNKSVTQGSDLYIFSGGNIFTP